MYAVLHKKKRPVSNCTGYSQNNMQKPPVIPLGPLHDKFFCLFTTLNAELAQLTMTPFNKESILEFNEESAHNNTLAVVL